MATTEAKQEIEMKVAEPQKEHQWLQRLVGEWTFEGEAPSGPGEEPQKFTGTEKVRSLGGLWVVAEGRGQMPGGGEGLTILTLGYDPQKGHYVGTWVGSMMTNMWVYKGELDAAGKALSLRTEGPNMMAEGQMAKYEEVIEFKSDDHRTFTSSMLNDDGTSTQMMVANYRRKN